MFAPNLAGLPGDSGVAKKLAMFVDRGETPVQFNSLQAPKRAGHRRTDARIERVCAQLRLDGRAPGRRFLRIAVKRGNENSRIVDALFGATPDRKQARSSIAV
jgi:hypothetical protein